MDEQQQREHTAGRSIKVSVWGGDLDSLELAALDSARRFFGTEVRLEVVRDYQVFHYQDTEPAKRYHANITVQEI
jgi:hypothetical protein